MNIKGNNLFLVPWLGWVSIVWQKGSGSYAKALFDEEGIGFLDLQLRFAVV